MPGSQPTQCNTLGLARGSGPFEPPTGGSSPLPPPSPPHGFRSSFRDWAAEETNHPREVAEAALVHKVRSQIEAAYRRSDLFERRRRLMDDWAGYPAGGRRGAGPIG